MNSEMPGQTPGPISSRLCRKKNISHRLHAAFLYTNSVNVLTSRLRRRNVLSTRQIQDYTLLPRIRGTALREAMSSLAQLQQSPRDAARRPSKQNVKPTWHPEPEPNHTGSLKVWRHHFLGKNRRRVKTAKSTPSGQPESKPGNYSYRQTHF